MSQLKTYRIKHKSGLFYRASRDVTMYGYKVKSNLTDNPNSAKTYSQFPSLDWCKDIYDPTLVTEENVEQCSIRYAGKHRRETTLSEWIVVEYTLDSQWRRKGMKSNVVEMKEYPMGNQSKDVEVELAGDVYVVPIRSPEDVVVLKTDFKLSKQQTYAMQDELKIAFPNNRCVVLGLGMKLEVVSDERENSNSD